MTASILRDFLQKDSRTELGNQRSIVKGTKYYLLLIDFIAVLATFLLFGQITITGGAAAIAL